jgi:FolB domain-containing protein
VSDRLELRGLRLLGVHGALSFERLGPQPFEVDLSIETDFSSAAKSDELSDAIDYGVVVERVRDIVENERFSLLEALAESIATTILLDQRIGAVTVSLRKLRPPVPVDLSSAGVVITRRKSG